MASVGPLAPARESCSISLRFPISNPECHSLEGGVKWISKKLKLVKSRGHFLLS